MNLLSLGIPIILNLHYLGAFSTFYFVTSNYKYSSAVSSLLNYTLLGGGTGNIHLFVFHDS